MNKSVSVCLVAWMMVVASAASRGQGSAQGPGQGSAQGSAHSTLINQYLRHVS